MFSETQLIYLIKIVKVYAIGVSFFKNCVVELLSRKIKTHGYKYS